MNRIRFILSSTCKYRTNHKRFSKCVACILYVCFLCFCFNIWQRFMRSCVPEGRNLTCCLSSQSWHPLSSLDYHQVEAYRASKRHKMCLCVCRYVQYVTLIGKLQHVSCVSQEELHHFCLLSTKRDTQAHAPKCEYKHICLMVTTRRHVISLSLHQYIHHYFLHYPSVQGMGGSWEARLVYVSKDPRSDWN